MRWCGGRNRGYRTSSGCGTGSGGGGVGGCGCWDDRVREAGGGALCCIGGGGGYYQMVRSWATVMRSTSVR